MNNSITLTLLFLVACGGQSGENGKEGLQRLPCDVTSTETLSAVSETEWPDGLADLVTAYSGVGGEWTATLVCLDEEDESASITLDVAATDNLSLKRFEGAGCDGDFGVFGETTFHLQTASFDVADLELETWLTDVVLMTAEGIDLRLSADGTLTTAIDKYNWVEAGSGSSSHSDATCELHDLARPATD